MLRCFTYLKHLRKRKATYHDYQRMRSSSHCLTILHQDYSEVISLAVLITASVIPECQDLPLNNISVKVRYSSNQAGYLCSTEKTCIAYFPAAGAFSRPLTISVRHGLPPAVSTHLFVLVCTKLKGKSTSPLKCTSIRDPACCCKLATPAILTNRVVPHAKEKKH